MTSGRPIAKNPPFKPTVAVTPARRPSVAPSRIRANDASAAIRVLVAGDHTISRSGLRALLETQPDLVVVGELADVSEAVRSTHELRPDVLVVVVSAAGLGGGDVFRQMAAECAAVRTILLTSAIDTSDTVTALRFGVRGIVLKDSPTHLLFKSIRCVFAGEVWLGRDTVTDVVGALPSLSAQPPQKGAAYNLTTREREVLTLVVAGYANRDAARALSISEDTVKHHLTSIFDKTGASNRLELALFAIHHHLVASP